MNDIEDIETYSQVIAVLQYISDIDYYKIPAEERDFYFEHADPYYCFHYNPKKSLNENNVSAKAKIVLAHLFEKYWATENQKHKLKEYSKIYYKKIGKLEKR